MTTTPETPTRLRRVQVSNTQSGEYDVRLSLPYPYWIEQDGAVARQDVWRGSPARLVGFQRDPDSFQVDLFAEDWLATEDPAPAGWLPVFSDAGGGFWTCACPVID